MEGKCRADIAVVEAEEGFVVLPSREEMTPERVLTVVPGVAGFDLTVGWVRSEKIIGAAAAVVDARINPIYFGHKNRAMMMP
ncbi:hypothetical protein ACLOJK_018796, partial [Asimina triloba]